MRGGPTLCARQSRATPPRGCLWRGSWSELGASCGAAAHTSPVCIYFKCNGHVPVLLNSLFLREKKSTAIGRPVLVVVHAYECHGTPENVPLGNAGSDQRGSTAPRPRRKRPLKYPERKGTRYSANESMEINPHAERSPATTTHDDGATSVAVPTSIIIILSHWLL